MGLVGLIDVLWKRGDQLGLIGVGLWKIIGIGWPKKKCRNKVSKRALVMVAGCISGMMCGVVSLLF